MTKRSAIIVDIDGTVADSRHRVHHIVNPEGKVDWAAWDADAHLDTPIPWTIELVMAMYKQGYKLLFVTGRADRIVDVTWQWLNDNFPGVVMSLMMRKNGDHRPDTEIKEEIYRDQIQPYYDVLFAIDDKASVVDHWRKLGVPCLECDRWTKEMEESAKHYLKKEFKQ